MDPDAVAPRQTLHVDGVVKVLGVHPVYGEDPKAPEVLPPPKLRLGDLQGDGLRLLQDLLGELGAEAVLGDDGLRLRLGGLPSPRYARKVP